MEKEYEYNVVEKSLSQDFLIKYIWNPVSLRLPQAITPNMISVIGFIFVFISLYGVWLATIGQRWGYLLTALTVFLYMLCDNVDGLHARRTKQTSKLGEFLDHWLDSFAFVVVNSCIAFCFGFSNEIFFIYIALMVFAFYATMWEHHYTGVFISGTLGSNESLLVYIVFYITMYFVENASWLVYDGNNMYCVSFVLGIVAALGSISAGLGCLVRVKKHFVDILVFCGALVAIYFGNYYGLLSTVFIGILVGLLNAIFCGKLIKEHLVKKKSPYRYIVIVLVIIVTSILIFIPQASPFLSSYVIAIICLLFFTAMTDGLQTILLLK